MDAQVFNLNEQRSRRAVAMPAFDPLAATQSATEFFSAYAEMMVAVHVSMVRAAADFYRQGCQS